MRSAILYEREWEKLERGGRYIIVEVGPVIFHEFGCNFEEFETGPGNFSTAIIEHPSGKVENVPVEMIRFTEGDQS